MHVGKKNQQASFIFWEGLQLLGRLSREPENKKKIWLKGHNFFNPVKTNQTK